MRIPVWPTLWTFIFYVNTAHIRSAKISHNLTENLNMEDRALSKSLLFY